MLIYLELYLHSVPMRSSLGAKNTLKLAVYPVYRVKGTVVIIQSMD